MKIKILLLAFLMIVLFVYYVETQTVKEGYGLSNFIRDSKEFARRMEKVKEFAEEAF